MTDLPVKCPKPPDYFGNISLTRGIFRKYFKRKCFSKSNSQISFNCILQPLQPLATRLCWMTMIYPRLSQAKCLVLFLPPRWSHKSCSGSPASPDDRLVTNRVLNVHHLVFSFLVLLLPSRWSHNSCSKNP